MTRLRRVGLAFVFSITLAGGVLVARPAQAALPGGQCARIASAISSLTALAARFPDNQLIALFLQELQNLFDTYCS